MVQKEKMAYLTNHHFAEWVKTRIKVEAECSDAQEMFCCCGRLATGLHERRCSKFQAKVNAATVKRLAHLLPQQ